MERDVIQGLVKRGLPLHVALGATGNMLVESPGLKTGQNEIAPLVPGSRGGFGLNMWTGPRRRQYEEFARSRGAPLDDLDTQLDFTVWELQNTEKGAMQALMATDNPIEAARVYSNRFLRPGTPHLDRRIAETQRLAGGDYQAGPEGETYQPGDTGTPFNPQYPQQNALAKPDEPQNRLAYEGQDPRAFMIQPMQNALAKFNTQNPYARTT